MSRCLLFYNTLFTGNITGDKYYGSDYKIIGKKTYVGNCS